MPKIGSSPMNLAVVMSPATTAASGGEGGQTTQYMIVFYQSKYDPPEGWTECDDFVPDATANNQVVVDDQSLWSKKANKFSIYKKVT